MSVPLRVVGDSEGYRRASFHMESEDGASAASSPTRVSFGKIEAIQHWQRFHSDPVAKIATIAECHEACERGAQNLQGLGGASSGYISHPSSPGGRWRRQQSAPAGEETVTSGSSSPNSRILARRLKFNQSKKLQIDTSVATSSTRASMLHARRRPGACPQSGLSPSSSQASCLASDFGLDGGEPSAADGTSLVDAYEETVEVLGRGAFGIVKAGRRKEDGEEVALKIGYDMDEGKQQCARREWEILSTLSHPNVVAAYGLYCTPEKIVLALERVRGVSLKKVVANSAIGRLSEGSSWHLGKCLLDAVAYLHSKPIVHRDIKSTNVMVETNLLSLRLIDFNCARRLSEKDDESCTPFCGTRRWAAPEVLSESTTSLSTANDVWALGLVLHLMLVGSLPSEHFGVNPYVQLKELDTVNVSRACKDFVLLCLERDAAVRPHASKLLAEPWLRNGCLCTDEAAGSVGS